MPISTDRLRENYRRLTDDKLLRIATEDAAKLLPEALTLLQAELTQRGLAEVAGKAIDAQFRVLSVEEVEELCTLLRNQPCPKCHSLGKKLNATQATKVLSFLIMTTQKQQFLIACPTCLDKFHHDATISSALLGWWGLPWGLIHTPRAIFFNEKMKKANHSPHSSELLKDFVIRNVGRIEAARDSSMELQRVLQAESN